MTQYVNIQNSDQARDFTARLVEARYIAFDTETTGLKPYHGDTVFSMSFYFPEFDEAYNFPFAAGDGKVKVSSEAPFTSMPWSKKARKQQYLRHWWETFRAHKQNTEQNYWNNVRFEKPFLMRAIKTALGDTGKTWIMHNAKFDCHVLNAAGLPVPDKIEDTMLALHTVFEDWGNIKVKVGDDKVPANRQLKFQAQVWNLPNALDGQSELLDNIQAFERELVDFILQHPMDAFNNRLITKRKRIEVKVDNATILRREETDGEYYARCFTAVQSKIQLVSYDKKTGKRKDNAKGYMWMLPSEKTAYYAMLDVVLTWRLREATRSVIEKWDNWQLYQDQCRTQRHVAWEMERQGFKLDEDEAKRQMELLKPRIEELEKEFRIEAITMPGFDSATFNPHSPTQLKAFFLARGIKLYSTESKVLKEYADDDPWIKKVLELRKAAKTTKTYLKRWLTAQDSKHIVRFDMNTTGTYSGRWSSSGDGGNGQNIPDRNGYTIKESIVTLDENWIFLGIDYSALELRLATWIAEVLLKLDPNMSMYQVVSGDPHSHTRDVLGLRDILFPGMSDDEIMLARGYSPEKTPKEWAKDHSVVVQKAILRQIAKTANFGLLYRGGKRMLSKLLNIPLEQADVIVKLWNDLYPAFARANEYYEKQANTLRPAPNGTGSYMYATQPISGRHRKIQYYDTFASGFKKGRYYEFNPRKDAGRKVFNNVVQGLGGYICTTSALRMHDLGYGMDRLRWFANIHDALDGYVHRDHLSIIPDLCRIMCDWDTDPKLAVEWTVSQNNWQTLLPVKNFDLFVSSRGYDGY